MRAASEDVEAKCKRKGNNGNWLQRGLGIPHPRNK
jgi:hypothetical protein